MPTVPLPLPLAPEVTVSQVALLAAVHAHPPDEVTVTVLDTPAAGADWAVAESVNVHGAALIATWVSAKVWPATVKVAVRVLVLLAGATSNAAVPEPLPPAV